MANDFQTLSWPTYQVYLGFGWFGELSRSQGFKPETRMQMSCKEDSNDVQKVLEWVRQNALIRVFSDLLSDH